MDNMGFGFFENKTNERISVLSLPALAVAWEKMQQEEHKLAQLCSLDNFIETDITAASQNLRINQQIDSVVAAVNVTLNCLANADDTEKDLFAVLHKSLLVRNIIYQEKRKHYAELGLSQQEAFARSAPTDTTSTLLARNLADLRQSRITGFKDIIEKLNPKIVQVREELRLVLAKQMDISEEHDTMSQTELHTQMSALTKQAGFNALRQEDAAIKKLIVGSSSVLEKQSFRCA